jgi:hypothetical protein
VKRWEVCKRKHCLTLLRLYFSSCLQGLWNILLRTASHHAHILNMESCKYEMSANYCTMFFANTTFSNTLNTYVKKGTKDCAAQLISGKFGNGVHFICYVVGNTTHSKCHPRFHSFSCHMPHVQPQSAA